MNSVQLKKQRQAVFKKYLALKAWFLFYLYFFRFFKK